MGKRFGRNQKRKMRLQIQEQARLIDRNNLGISSLGSALQQANETINFTAEILGQHFIGLPVKTVEVKELLQRYEYAIHQPVSNLLHASCNPVAGFVDAALGYIETHQGVVYADELRHLVHMRYSSRSGAVGYGLSDHAWRNLTEKQLIKLMQEQVAVDMATLLVRERKKARIG